jgi:solute carrier family 35, member E1
MVKLNILVIVASICAVSAFALPLSRQKSGTSSILSTTGKAKQVFHDSPTFLKATGAEASSSSTEVVAADSKKKGILSYIVNDTTSLLFYLAIWYIGNIYYNIYNKRACMALGKNAAGQSNIHWMLSAIQLLVGGVAVLPLWMFKIRARPKITFDNLKEMAPVGLFASLAHAFSVLALGAGAVSFGQIVKAGEPVFAAATNAILLGDIDHPVVYLALVPIIGGVGLASLKELSFTWVALIAASLANQAAALKNVVSKGVMKKPWAKALGAGNNYAIVTWLALLFTLPFVAIFDLKDLKTVYDQVVKMGTKQDVINYSILSGLAFYAYNEAAFQALDKLNPVTHSVANTLKRVVIIVASCIVFNTPMSLLGGIGSAIAVLGTLLYSLAKKKYSGSAH